MWIYSLVLEIHHCFLIYVPHHLPSLTLKFSFRDTISLLSHDMHEVFSYFIAELMFMFQTNMCNKFVKNSYILRKFYDICITTVFCYKKFAILSLIKVYIVLFIKEIYGLLIIEVLYFLWRVYVNTVVYF